ncbi:MAG: hypothetical protein QM776_05870 [Rhodocyclaceae bacterium]
MTRHLCWLTLSLACLATGCAQSPARQTIQNYTPPTTGKLAKLQLRSSALAGTGLLYAFDESRSCGSPKLMGDSRKTSGQFQSSVTVQAETPSTLWFIHSPVAGRICGVMVTFRAASDHNYAVLVGPSDTGNCQINVLDITDPADPRPERFIFQRKPSGVGATTGAYCETANVDTELTKPRKVVRSGMVMDDLKDILPPDTVTTGGKP